MVIIVVMGLVFTILSAEPRVKNYRISVYDVAQDETTTFEGRCRLDKDVICDVSPDQSKIYTINKNDRFEITITQTKSSPISSYGFTEVKIPGRIETEQTIDLN